VADCVLRPMAMRMLFFLSVVAIAAISRSAHADEVAPALEQLDLRARAEMEQQKLFAHLPGVDQKRLAGTYLATDDDPSDPIAMVACDDDGDDVVVLSDALLRLAWNVAVGASYDEASPARRVEAYATFLARSQLPGRRLLPPPPGTFVAAKPADTRMERFHEIIDFVVARELAHFRAGDLACRKPTATREAGDAVWTAAERRAALGTAPSVYLHVMGRGLERDEEATLRVLDVGVGVEGALAWLRFWTQFEVDRVVAGARFEPSYAKLHPGSGARLATVKNAAEARARSREL
jgi:hypothetical protein